MWVLGGGKRDSSAGSGHPFSGWYSYAVEQAMRGQVGGDGNNSALELWRGVFSIPSQHGWMDAAWFNL